VKRGGETGDSKDWRKKKEKKRMENIRTKPSRAEKAFLGGKKKRRSQALGHLREKDLRRKRATIFNKKKGSTLERERQKNFSDLTSGKDLTLTRKKCKIKRNGEGKKGKRKERS